MTGSKTAPFVTLEVQVLRSPSGRRTRGVRLEPQNVRQSTRVTTGSKTARIVTLVERAAVSARQDRVENRPNRDPVAPPTSEHARHDKVENRPNRDTRGADVVNARTSQPSVAAHGLGAHSRAASTSGFITRERRHTA